MKPLSALLAAVVLGAAACHGAADLRPAKATDVPTGMLCGSWALAGEAPESAPDVPLRWDFTPDGLCVHGFDIQDMPFSASWRYVLTDTLPAHLLARAGAIAGRGPYLLFDFAPPAADDGHVRFGGGAEYAYRMESLSPDRMTLLMRRGLRVTLERCDAGTSPIRMLRDFYTRYVRLVEPVPTDYAALRLLLQDFCTPEAIAKYDAEEEFDLFLDAQDVATNLLDHLVILGPKSSSGPEGIYRVQYPANDGTGAYVDILLTVVLRDGAYRIADMAPVVPQE